MDKFSKYALYFLVGILVYYLLYNNRLVEGFGEEATYTVNIISQSLVQTSIECTKSYADIKIPKPASLNNIKLSILYKLTKNMDNSGFYSNYTNNLTTIILQTNIETCTGSVTCESDCNTDEPCITLPASIYILQYPNVINNNTDQIHIFKHDNTDNNLKIFNIENNSFISMDGEGVVQAPSTGDVVQEPSTGGEEGPNTGGEEGPNTGGEEGPSTGGVVQAPSTGGGAGPSTGGAQGQAEEGPCKNNNNCGVNGTCSPLGSNGYECVCADGYTGSLCNEPAKTDWTCNNGIAESGTTSEPNKENCASCYDGFYKTTSYSSKPTCLKIGNCINYEDNCDLGQSLNASATCQNNGMNCDKSDCCEPNLSIEIGITLCIIICIAIMVGTIYLFSSRSRHKQAHNILTDPESYRYKRP